LSFLDFFNGAALCFLHRSQCILPPRGPPQLHRFSSSIFISPYYFSPQHLQLQLQLSQLHLLFCSFIFYSPSYVLVLVL
jgi:hypothetical protein